MAGIFSTILTSSGRYLAAKLCQLGTMLAGIFKSEDSPGWYFLENLDYWLVFFDQFGLLAGIFKVLIVLAGIFGPIWTTGRYFWTNLDYWPVFLDQFGLLAGIFGPIWTSPISKVGWYFYQP